MTVACMASWKKDVDTKLDDVRKMFQTLMKRSFVAEDDSPSM